MKKIYSDYYYRLGRKQALIELNENVAKTLPVGISPYQKVSWDKGYRDMLENFSWRREAPELDLKNSEYA